MSSGTVEVAAGVEQAWAAHGDGDLPVLVLVHGFTGSAADWAGVVDALAEVRRVVTVEHRGHGASTNTGDASTYTFARLEADLAATLDALGLDRFDLLGHSMGGVVSMRYALAHPERLRSLVLMDTAAKADPVANPNDWFRSGIERIRRTGDLVEMLGSFVGALPEDVAARMTAAWGAMDPVAFVALGDELLAYDDGLLARLAGLAVPTTVLVGEHDTGLRGGSDDLAATIPDARLVVIPDAAHSPQFEHRSAWLDAVCTHLSDTGQGGGGTIGANSLHRE